jgi:hypothetical protein
MNLPNVGFNRSAVFSEFNNNAITNADARKPQDFYPYFGKPESDEYLLNQDTTFKRNLQLPYAYRNKPNPYLSTVIIGLSIQTDDFLLTSPFGCPIEHTTDQTFQWGEEIWDEGPLDIVPEEGIPTIFRMAETSTTATTMRYGKSMLLEHGFMYTAKGQQHYVRQIQQISNAMKITMTACVIYEMLKTRPRQMKYLADVGHFSKPTREILRHYYSKFAAAQKSSKGIDDLIYDGKNVLKNRGHAANMLIVSTGGECFFNGVGPEKTNYQMAGPSATALNNSDPWEKTRNKWGVAINYTREYKVGSRAGAPMVDPLIRHRIYGEYFKAFQFPYSSCSPLEYKTCMRDVDIYNWEADQWGTISLRECVDNWMAFDTDDYILGANPNKAEIKLKPSPDGKMNTLFGTVGPRGWVVARYMGQLDPAFYSDDMIEKQTLQILGLPGVQAESRIRKLASKVPHIQAIGLEEICKRALIFLDKDEQEFKDPAGVGAQTEFKASRFAPKNADKEMKATFISTNLGAGTLRELAFGYLLKPESLTTDSKTVESFDIDSLDKENLALLEKHAVSAENISKYTAAQTISGMDKSGFVKRTNEVLKGDVSKINDDLMTPLTTLVSKASARKAPELIAMLCTPLKISTEMTATKTSTVPETSALGFYPVSKDFVAVSPYTAEPTNTPFKLDLSSLDGLSGTIAALSLNSNAHEPHIGKELVPYKAGAYGEGSNDYEDFPDDSIHPNLNGFKFSDKAFPQIQKRIYSLYEKYLKQYDNNRNIPAPGDFSNQRYNEMNAGASQENLLKYVIGVYLCFAPLHRNYFNYLLSENIYFPFNYIIARNWFTTQTNLGILGQGGSALGTVFTGNEDLMLGDDANTKMHIGTYTVNIRCVIFNPLMLLLLDDIWCKQYTGGGNLTPFKPEQLRVMKAHQFRAGTSYDRPSWFPIAVPIGQPIDDIIDVRGYFDKEVEKKHFITTHNHTSFFEDLPATTNPGRDASNPKYSYNSAMVQGTQKCYNFVTRQNDAVIMGINHPLGPNIYTGCKKDLEARRDVLKEQNYEKQVQYKLQNY